MQFRKRLTVAPGIHLTISKGGLGVSVGGKGMHYSIGPHGQHVSVGIPGTGVYYRQSLGKGGGLMDTVDGLLGHHKEEPKTGKRRRKSDEYADEDVAPRSTSGRRKSASELADELKTDDLG